MLNLKHLHVLQELARLGTLAGVAHALHFTPSAVSQQLSALQKEAGVPLIEHVGRNVRLTPAGQRLAEHSQAVFDRLAVAESELAAGHGEPRGRLRVASFHTVLLDIAPVALTMLAESYPELEVQLIHEEVEAGHAGLLTHDYDLVLGEEFPGFPVPAQPGVQRLDFYTDPLFLAMPARPGAHAHPAGRGLAGQDRSRGPRRMHDLAGLPWAFEPQGSRMGDWALSVCHRYGFSPRVVIQTPDPLLHLQLVRRGLAIGFVPGLVGSEQLSGVDVFELPGRPSRTLYTEVRAGREGHPALRAVREAFREAALTLEDPEAAGVIAPA